MEQTIERATGNGIERKRIEAVVETLATLGNRGETVAEVAHDARNMVTALGLYCDLLEEPGVLTHPFAHYGPELRLVASASRRLVEKLLELDVKPGMCRETAVAAASSHEGLHAGSRYLSQHRPETSSWDLLPALPVANLATELLANHNLLAALAGPAITLTVDVEGGASPVRLTGEDLTRVLVNLVKNAAEAMPRGGRIEIDLRQIPASAGAAESLSLTVADSGPGIAQEVLEKVFASGYTTRLRAGEGKSGWTAAHRGLGLSIARSIVESAGGRIFAGNRPSGGACFEIELPVRKSRE